MSAVVEQSTGTGKDIDLLEYCCDPASTLTDECNKRGQNGQRLNRENGWDFDLDTTLARGKQWVQENRVRRHWGSTPCTEFSAWQVLNWHRWDSAGQDAHVARRLAARKLNKRVMQMMLASLDQSGGHVFWGWPQQCSGWWTQEMQWLRRQLELRGRKVITIKLDGCMVGARS